MIIWLPDILFPLSIQSKAECLSPVSAGSIHSLAVNITAPDKHRIKFLREPRLRKISSFRRRGYTLQVLLPNGETNSISRWIWNEVKNIA